jgi:DNA replication protein DnaC
MRARQTPWITVGVGKSHIAQALAHLAIRSGATARFLKTSRALAHLADGRADRTSDRRLGELTRPAVLILDNFAMRDLTAVQADDLYEFITERSGKPLILTSTAGRLTVIPCYPSQLSPNRSWTGSSTPATRSS